jgi:hypothetical protein
VSITVVAAANNPPNAVDDTYTTAEDTTLTVAAPGVLANDTDADGDTLTVGANTNRRTAPSSSPGGSFVYTPAATTAGRTRSPTPPATGAAATDTATVP